jgi:hypothetical protein
VLDRLGHIQAIPLRLLKLSGKKLLLTQRLNHAHRNSTEFRSFKDNDRLLTT